jgi:hypothetical protein
MGMIGTVGRVEAQGYTGAGCGVVPARAKVRGNAEQLNKVDVESTSG